MIVPATKWAAVLGGAVEACSSLEDTFTDTNGTALTAHAPDCDPVGGGWAHLAGTFQIQSNHCENNSHGGDDIAVIDSGLADFTLQCLLTPQGNGGANRHDTGFVFRCTDVNNLWLAALRGDLGNVTLYEKTASVYTNRGSWAGAGIGSGVQTNVRVVTSGASIQIYINGTLRISHVSAQHQTATKCGVRSYFNGAPPAEAEWDDLAVTA